MKRITFLLCAAALLGTLTSCHRSMDDSPNVSVILDQSRTLVVTTNTPADLTYEGETFKNTTHAVFKNASAKGKLNVTPRSDMYFGQEDMAVDFYDKSLVAINVQLVKKPTISVSQEDAKSGIEVTNDKENQEATGVTAIISVPESTEITGSTADFTITTFVPAMTVLEETEEGAEVEASVLVIRCTPDGASFNPPITVKLHIPNSTGLDLVCRYADDATEEVPMVDLGDDWWNVTLSHFSDWYNILKAKVISRTPGEEYTMASVEVKEGNNPISYKVKCGGIETSTSKCLLVTNFIEEEYGLYYEFTKDATLRSDSPGVINYCVIQPYEDIVYRSRLCIFSVRVFGEPTIEIINTRPGKLDGHSGGAGS